MDPSNIKEPSAYLEFRAELDRVLMPNHVRIGAGVTIGINIIFSGLDRFAFPIQSWDMLVWRGLLFLVLFAVLFRGYSLHPVGAMWTVTLATLGMLVAVVYQTDSPSTTDYYVGLMLFVMGVPVMVPVNARQTALLVALALGAFVAAPVFGLGGFSRAFAIHLIFLASGGIVGMASAAMLDSGRFKDFVRRRQIESARDQLRQLDEAKSRFSANIHHELRTPLTLMLAPLDSMLAGEFGAIPPAQRSYLETMHKNALRLLKLINNLLDHARIESGLMEVHRQPLELARAVEEVVESARAMAERKRVALEAEWVSGLPIVNADPDALEKVLVNLVGNALKFTDPGGRITVSAQPASGARAEAAEPGEELPAGVELIVADTGAGIPPDELERVFDRFAQVDGSATRRHEGTGIGLSLVRELVALHGGRTWATSEGLGHGSQFHVFLPLGTEDADAEEVVRTDDGRGVTLRRSFDAIAADLDHHAEDDARGSLPIDGDSYAARYKTVELERTVERFEAAEGRTPDAAAVSPAQRPEVVVAEDNADMRRLLAHLLGAEFAVRPARNGREALELVRERMPALVVTDVMMPEMSGTELCEAIKGDAALAGVPVMLVTSKAEREMKIQGLELGADDYVTKPFHPRELLARARALVRLRLLQEELAEQNAALDRALQHLRATEVQLIHSERLAAVGELAAGVAHEVNNPVNFALNSLRVLRETVGEVREFAGRLAAIDWCDASKLPERVGELQRLEGEIGLEEAVATLDELVAIVIEGLERTGRLVADLRDFGAPGERGQRHTDVADALGSTLAIVGSSLASKGIRLEREIAPDLPLIEGDAGALKQLFLNLLKNAAEALEETGGTVRVRAARSASGRGVEVTVSDDGPGVEPAQAERIFEPFFTTKAAGRGTGLGLSICRRIAEAHGGSLAVRSTPGAGATFTLGLPVEAHDATASRS
ncbi:MAG: ATP-binding protein [Deltaproteobacteria bacterium]|nr:response regulator [Sorangiineae bacterium PRO1]MEB2343264.1 ATP-binding protein [Deltaproteobacteria bacterium]